MSEDEEKSRHRRTWLSEKGRACAHCDTGTVEAHCVKRHTYCGQFRDMREKYFEKTPHLIPLFLKLSQTDQMQVHNTCNYNYSIYCLHNVCKLDAFFLFHDPYICTYTHIKYKLHLSAKLICAQTWFFYSHSIHYLHNSVDYFIYFIYYNY